MIECSKIDWKKDYLFEVWGPDGFRKMCTDDVLCISCERELSSMESCGHTFKLNGKKASRKQVVEFIKEHGRDPENPRFQELSGGCTTSGKILCVTTGKTYDRQSDAAKDLGIDPAQVSDSLKTGRPRSGYIFQKV